MKGKSGRWMDFGDIRRAIRFTAILLALLTGRTAWCQDSAPPQGQRDQAAPRLEQELASMRAEMEKLGARVGELERQLAEARLQPAAISAESNEPAQTPARMQHVALTSKDSSSFNDQSLYASERLASASPAPGASMAQNPNEIPHVGLPSAAPAKTVAEPFAFADFTWLNGTSRTKQLAVDTKFFTPEVRADVSYTYDFNNPKDNSIGGSTQVFRANEFQLAHLGLGGNFHYDNVRARVLSQLGLYSQTQPRNDASVARGQYALDNAYRYVSEAYGGYHFNALHGVNVDAGIFLSYIGLFSFYTFDNWAYQPSYVSANTPFFFNGLRVQVFPTDKLKIEGWLVNGWQSYGRFNNRPGVGGVLQWSPTGWLSVTANQYVLGADTPGTPGRIRYHSDESVQVKYYDRAEGLLDRMAFSLTGDIGCEHGGGVSCTGGSAKGPKQSFLGFMAYNRFWFHKDLYAITAGGGRINNPGRYLVLLPPINGATAISGSPYFTQNPGDPFKAWDASGTFDYMPSQYITFRWEFNHRAANVPYFSGRGGITPNGGNTGNPGVLVPGFVPDLRKDENRINMSLLVKF